MAVTRTSVGSMISGTAAITVTFGAGAAAGNLGIMVVETAKETAPTPTGWTLYSASTGFGTAGTAGASKQTIFYRASITSGEVTSGVSLSDSGDHQNAVLITYSGHDATTPIIDCGGFNESSTATTSAATAFSGLNASNVTANDNLLGVFTTDRDSATVSTNTSWAWNNINGGANAGSVILNASSASGAGGGIILNEIVNTAAVGNVTVSVTITSSAYSAIALAIKAPASGRTATLAKTLAAVTVSSNAVLKLSGTLSKTLAVVTLSSASKVAIAAALSKTLGAVTLSSASKVDIAATLSKTLGNVTLSSHGGATPVTGTLANTLSTVTLSAASKLSIKGTLSKTLGTLTSSETGTLLIKGSVAKTLAVLTFSSSAKLSLSATVAKTLATSTLSSFAKISIKGRLSKTLGQLTATDVAQLLIRGTLSKTLGNLSLASTGITIVPNPIAGTFSKTLGSLTLTAHTLGFRTSLRRKGRLGEPINAYRNHKYVRNGSGYWTK